MTDHLGNTRVVVSGQGEVVQRNDYYAFGLAIDAVDRTVNKYKFLGREEQPQTGWVDLIKRMYDPPTGRFTSVDPSPDVEGQESLTTYQYGWNNPLRYPDPNGDCPTCPQQFISWLVGGYYKYIKGGVDYARNEAQHNTRSEYTERVPEQTRNINYAVGKAKAIQTSVEGATQIVESHMTMIGLLEGGAIAAVKPVISEVKEISKIAAHQLRSSGKKLPTMVAAAKDRVTGEIVVSTSGKPRPNLVSPLKEQAPNPSLEFWPCNNCAETKAVNSLVRDGSKIENVEYHTVRTRTGQSEVPCKNCEKTLIGATKRN